MTSTSTLAEFAPALAAAVTARDGEALRNYLAGGDLPLLGEREPTEIIRDALQTVPDRATVSKALAKLLAELLAEERRDISRGRGARAAENRQVLLSAVRLAADLPAEPHLFRGLKELLAAIAAPPIAAELATLRLPLLHALIYQQTDGSREDDWFRILAEIPRSNPLSPTDRTLLFEAWRGLLWIPPPKGGDASVVDMDRVDRGLHAIRNVVPSPEERLTILVHAFSILSDTFPRSIDFWRSRLGTRVRSWQGDLLEAAFQVWPGLRPVPAPHAGLSSAASWFPTLEHLISQWAIARAGFRDAPSPWTISNVKAFLLSREAEWLELTRFFQPSPFVERLSVSSSLVHRLKGSLELAEVCWFVKPSSTISFNSRYHAHVIGTGEQMWDSISEHYVSEKLNAPHIARFIAISSGLVDPGRSAGTRPKTLTLGVDYGTSSPSQALAIDFGSPDAKVFVSHAVAPLPGSDVRLLLFFQAPSPGPYFAALEKLQTEAQDAALGQLHVALKSAWHPLERRFLRAFLVICALKKHDFQAALTEISDPMADASAPVEYAILSLHAHAASGSRASSRQMLEGLMKRFSHLTPPARQACKLIDRAYGLSGPTRRPPTEELEPELIQRELELLEVSATSVEASR